MPRPICPRTLLASALSDLQHLERELNDGGDGELTGIALPSPQKIDEEFREKFEKKLCLPATVSDSSSSSSKSNGSASSPSFLFGFLWRFDFCRGLQNECYYWIIKEKQTNKQLELTFSKTVLANHHLLLPPLLLLLRFHCLLSVCVFPSWQPTATRKKFC